MVQHSNAIDILQALLTPTIAAIAVGIAFAQWWTARNRLKLDLFDRRWTVYTAAQELIAAATAQGDVTFADLQKFFLETRGARWLFDDKVGVYLEKELRIRAARLRVLSAVVDAPGAPDREKASSNKSEIMHWMMMQDNVADAMFGPFLAVDQSFLHVLCRWARRRRVPSFAR